MTESDEKQPTSSVRLDKFVMPDAPGNLEAMDYVFACRWSDADWNDPWGIGFVKEVGKNHITICTEDGSLIPGIGIRGFQKALSISADQAGKIITEYTPREGTEFDPSIIAQILFEA